MLEARGNTARQFETRRWTTPTRWYDATIVYDLLGDWTIVRRWGGRDNRLHGQLVEVVADYPTARRRLHALDVERQRRHYQTEPERD